MVCVYCDGVVMFPIGARPFTNAIFIIFPGVTLVNYNLRIV